MSDDELRDAHGNLIPTHGPDGRPFGAWERQMAAQMVGDPKRRAEPPRDTRTEEYIRSHNAMHEQWGQPQSSGTSRWAEAVLDADQERASRDRQQDRARQDLTDLRRTARKGKELGWTDQQIANALNAVGAPRGPHTADDVAELLSRG
jgi:hypothetical protein